MLKTNKRLLTTGLLLVVFGADSVALGASLRAVRTSTAAHHAQSPSNGPGGSGPNWVAPFIPTPMRVVEKMLEVAGVTDDDKVFDLGSGDGRIVIAAAQKFGAQAVGVELDEELVKESSASIEAQHLQKRATILHADMFKVDLSSATVVTLYIVDSVNERLRPILEKQLRPGARVVVHDFRIPGWTPKEVVTVVSEQGVPHKIYLYVKQ